MCIADTADTWDCRAGTGGPAGGDALAAAWARTGTVGACVPATVCFVAAGSGVDGSGGSSFTCPGRLLRLTRFDDEAP